MFGFLSSKSMRTDVGAMVESFARVCPPPAKIGDRSVPERAINEALDALYRGVAAYAREKHLGVLGRARLAKALQDEMRQQQYPDGLVSRLINAVAVNALVVPDGR